jgi:hypothetical protein
MPIGGYMMRGIGPGGSVERFMLRGLGVTASPSAWDKTERTPVIDTTERGPPFWDLTERGPSA